MLKNRKVRNRTKTQDIIKGLNLQFPLITKPAYINFYFLKNMF